MRNSVRKIQPQVLLCTSENQAPSLDTQVLHTLFIPFKIPLLQICLLVMLLARGAPENGVRLFLSLEVHACV